MTFRIYYAPLNIQLCHVFEVFQRAVTTLASPLGEIP